MVSAARRLHRAQTRWHALAGCRSCTTQRCKAAARLACRACTAHPQTKPRCRLPPRPASPRFLLTNHDIWDGWGSYEEATQNCPVFQASRSRGRRRRRHWCRCCFHAPAAPCCPCMPSVWQQPPRTFASRLPAAYNVAAWRRAATTGVMLQHLPTRLPSTPTTTSPTGAGPVPRGPPLLPAVPAAHQRCAQRAGPRVPGGQRRAVRPRALRVLRALPPSCPALHELQPPPESLPPVPPRTLPGPMLPPLPSLPAATSTSSGSWGRRWAAGFSGCSWDRAPAAAGGACRLPGLAPGLRRC